MLAECEQRLLKGGSAAAYFDLLAGKSSGGIVVLGPSAGMRAAEVLNIYLTHGEKIFPKEWDPPFALGRAAKSVHGFARNLAVYRYDREALERALRDCFGNRTLGTVDQRQKILTFDGFNEVTVLKTPHHLDFRPDWQQEIVTAALAISAAPTLFSTYRNGTRHFANAGFWANKPAMVALVDAPTCYHLDRHTIDMLSLGCRKQVLRMSHRLIKWGGMFHWRTIIETAMHLQNQNALGQAGLLIRRERLLRVTTAPSLAPITLEDFERAQNELPAQARRLVEEIAERLEMFLDAERAPGTFHHREHVTAF